MEEKIKTHLANDLEQSAAMLDSREFDAVQLDNCASMMRYAATVIRQALANEALNKMADNASELGLDYMEGSAEQYQKELSAEQDSSWCMKMNGCKTKCEDCPDEVPKQPVQQDPTVDDSSQDWQGMDGAIAWHLIDRHADGWADVGKMMSEWLEANKTAPPAPAQDDRNKLADWMMKFAFATGHGDTMEDLLDALGTEIVDTIDAAREEEREACAKVCEELPAPSEYSMTDQSMWDVTCIDCAAAIRARKTNDQMDS